MEREASCADMPLVLAGLLAAAGHAAAEPLHHALQVRLDPAAHRVDVVDRLTLGDQLRPDADGAYRFLLHAGLAPEVTTAGWRLEPVPGPVSGEFLGLNASTETVADTVPLEGFRLLREAGAPDQVELRYGGVIHHPIEVAGEEYQRTFSETPGLVAEEGVFLAGASFWVPTAGAGLVTFELEVTGLTPPWDAVSQGRRVRHETAGGSRTTAWSCPDPTEEVYLVAAPWVEAADRFGEVELLALLRSEDPALAGRYLEATKRYLRLYQGLLPPYPYPSFALVESFWETGYGMPGFTLLGPKVIRFPWILTSSYPHELVHTWWGNSVYVDYEAGNWCEGLTAYLADHLFAQQKGEAAVYRRTTLQKFTDFVGSDQDLPLTAFRSRRSAASEAVGYGKSMMLFHMLRRAVGDEQFAAALGTFYDQQRFRRASWGDLARAFGEATGADWEPFIGAWTTRPGAPELEITTLEVVETGDPALPWQVTVGLRQAQRGEPFPLSVPVAITVEGKGEPVWAEVGSCSRDLPGHRALPGAAAPPRRRPRLRRHAPTRPARGAAGPLHPPRRRAALPAPGRGRRGRARRLGGAGGGVGEAGRAPARARPRPVAAAGGTGLAPRPRQPLLGDGPGRARRARGERRPRRR